MVTTVQKFPFSGLKNTSDIMRSSALSLDPTRGLTASHAPKLHWQLALARRGLQSRMIFQNSP